MGWSVKTNKEPFFLLLFFCFDSRELMAWNGLSLRGTKAKICRLDVWGWGSGSCSVVQYLLAMVNRVIPHPILQHQPTRQNTRVRNWAKPTKKLIRKLQNLLSQSLPWNSGGYLVTPQQQHKLIIPLRIVPEIYYTMLSTFLLTVLDFSIPDPGNMRLNTKQTIALGRERIGMAALMADPLTCNSGSTSMFLLDLQNRH